MIDSQVVRSSTPVQTTSNRAFTLAAAVYQALAALVFLISPVLALGWFRTPFPGAFVENTMVVNTIGLRNSDRWVPLNVLLDYEGFQLISADQRPVRSPGELQGLLNEYAPGRTIQLEVRSPVDGHLETVEVRLDSFTLRDQVTFFYLPYGLGAVYLLIGFWVFRRSRNTPAGRAFILFTVSTAVLLAALFDTWTTNRLVYVWSLALLLSGAGMLMTALVFPKPFAALERNPWLQWLPLLAVPALGYVYLPALFDMQAPARFAGLRGLGFAYAGFGVTVFILHAIITRFRSLSPAVREQSRLVFVGSMTAFLPLGVWFAGTLINLNLAFSPLLLLPFAVFPLSTAYAMMRYRFASTDYLISRGLLYAALTVFSVAFYILIVWGLNLLLGEAVAADSPLLVGFMIVLVAALFNPLRDRMQHSVDTFFFRGRAVYQEKLQEFSQDLTQVATLEDILKLVVLYAGIPLKPSRFYIFLLDPLTDQFSAVSNVEGLQSSDLRFSDDSALARFLAREQAPVIFVEGAPLPPMLKPERARISLLSTQMFVPMIGRKQLIGWIALAGRESGEPYTLQELSYLDTLSDQSALAVERAQVVVDLQRRVHEMNVLGRVAQGINVTLEFDDILELIYTQTSQVVPVEHFSITLFNEITNTSQHVFYLDAGDRLSRFENRALPKGLGLEQEVIRTGRAIQTDDYDSECRRRSVIPAYRDVYAWLGVPLAAGTRTIGSLCLGSRDAAVVFTNEQSSIIQSIADQAAGAITKTQLLAESERRTRQLETLNQVARSLTLELDPEPLLNRILESAVEIFHCEAGTLFLVEAETGEIIFSNVVGGAEDLVGTRLPPGTGLVGKCFDTGRPIIQNDVHTSKDWFDKTDEETGFTTRGLLVVPMRVREEIIGVIEVINKRDQMPFTPDDERLLMAFSAQAAVAVQNARLFRMTDQALADRVDELSVMQRIDRELNTSLDLTRAMRITLEWAMRQSRADAGLVGIVENGQLKVAELQGYSLLEPTEDLHSEVAGWKIVQDALAQTQPRAILTMEQTNRLLPDSGSQIAVSILRESRPIGVLLLESRAAFNFTSETMEFLNRLSDHAAIALANARLYSELQEANIAKSDFVSFVSHELKTPMTSIKGYADLLAQGAVGEINDAQAGFLGTIRSNVNRMATLVSDLADISRIEAGRMRLEYGPVGLGEVVEEVLRSSGRQVESKAIQLAVDLPEQLPPVWGDRTRLVQVLTNLVSNAVKYTPEGGQVRVQATVADEGDAAGASGYVQVAVTDSGIGIRPDEQAHIFTKFFRSEDLKAREVPGTGLGLNITKNLVELQGGRIWFESTYRKGSTFFFTIPIAG